MKNYRRPIYGPPNSTYIISGLSEVYYVLNELADAFESRSLHFNLTIILVGVLIIFREAKLRFSFVYLLHILIEIIQDS